MLADMKKERSQKQNQLIRQTLETNQTKLDIPDKNQHDSGSNCIEPTRVKPPLQLNFVMIQLHNSFLQKRNKDVSKPTSKNLINSKSQYK